MHIYSTTFLSITKYGHASAMFVVVVATEALPKQCFTWTSVEIVHLFFDYIALCASHKRVGYLLQRQVLWGVRLDARARVSNSCSHDKQLGASGLRFLC